MAEGAEHEPSIMTARARLPEHVVHRDFGGETVVLNLETGEYHGLNPTAGRMLEALGASSTVDAAVDELTRELGQPRGVVQRDLLTLCRGLGDRGLIEFEPVDT